MFNNSTPHSKKTEKKTAGNRCLGAPAPKQGVPLSKAHIRPLGREVRVEYVKGASLLRSTKDQKFDQVGGGKRGRVKGFSRASRRRLLEVIACVRRDAELPSFMTLTYPSSFPDVVQAKRDLKIFLQRLDRKYSGCGYIWKLEPQERGAPHFHLLVWGVPTAELLSWTVKTWYEIAGQGDRNHFLFHAGLLRDSRPCVEKVRSWRGVWAYAAKYLGKTFEVAEWGSRWTGRFWGVGNRENIPFGELQIVPVSFRDVVQIMRFQRRFMAMRGKKRNLNSLKTFCDADQWAAKVLGVVLE